MTDLHDPILVAVDGGGTGCRAVIGRASIGILGRGETGPANVTTDPTAAVDAVLAAVTQAAQTAELGDFLHQANAYLGLAGAQTAAQCKAVADAMPFARCTVTDDVPTAIAGALGRAAGAVLLIGTGTIVAATDGETLRRAGGWGLTLSDIGSAAWLGRMALARALEAHDGTLPQSELTAGLLAQFDNDPHRIVAFANDAGAADFGKIAPKVTSAASKGDVHAVSLMKHASTYFSRALDAVGYQVGDKLCLGGGTGPHYATYLPTPTVAPLGSSLDGAFMLAGQL